MGSCSSTLSIPVTVNFIDTNETSQLHIDISADSTISQLKNMIAERINYPAQNLRFLEPGNIQQTKKGENTKLKDLKSKPDQFLLIYSENMSELAAQEQPSVETSSSTSRTRHRSRPSQRSQHSATFSNFIPDRSTIFLPNFVLASNITTYSTSQFDILFPFLESSAESQGTNAAILERFSSIKNSSAVPSYFYGSLYVTIKRALVNGKILTLFLDNGGSSEKKFMNNFFTNSSVKTFLQANSYLYAITLAGTGRSFPSVPAAVKRLVPSIIQISALGGSFRVLSVHSITAASTVDAIQPEMERSVEVFLGERQGFLDGGITLAEATGFFDGFFSQPILSAASGDGMASGGAMSLQEQQELAEEREMRESSNLEYQESLLIDQAKEQSRIDEEERQLQLIHDMEASEAAKQAEEERAQHEKEEAAAKDQQSIASLYVEDATPEMVAAAPPGPDGNPPTLCTIQLRFQPPLQSITRHFLSTHTVANILAVIKTLHPELLGKEVKIVSLPRTVHTPEQTLTEAGAESLT